MNLNKSCDLNLNSSCRIDRKVDNLDDSVWFRTDAGVKVGRGNRRVNEQADFSVRVKARPVDTIFMTTLCCLSINDRANKNLD